MNVAYLSTHEHALRKRKNAMYNALPVVFSKFVFLFFLYSHENSWYNDCSLVVKFKADLFESSMTDSPANLSVDYFNVSSHPYSSEL